MRSLVRSIIVAAIFDAYHRDWGWSNGLAMSIGPTVSDDKRREKEEQYIHNIKNGSGNSNN